MKKIIIICTLIICATNSWAISKKKLLEQRDALIEKIMSEYQFQTDFKGISKKLHNKFDSDFEEMMSKVRNIEAGKYSYRREEPPYYLHIPNEKAVDEFRIKLICTDYYPNRPVVPRMFRPDRKYWVSEWDAIERLYPEVTELNKELNKKKCSDISVIIYAKWESNFNLTTPSIRDLVVKYNQKEKDEVYNRYKQGYESGKASKANDERLRKERAAKERARQEQIQREQVQKRWVDDSWMNGNWSKVLTGGAFYYDMYIDTAQQTIKLYKKSTGNHITQQGNLVYSGQYSISIGFDNYKIIKFGEMIIYAYPDNGKIKDSDGQDFFR